MIQNHGPGAFLGWIMFLEGIASVFGPTAVEKAGAHHKSMTRFLRVHAEEDQDHIRSAFELVENTNMDKNSHFMDNFRISAQLYCSVFKNIELQESRKSIAA